VTGLIGPGGVAGDFILIRVLPASLFPQDRAGNLRE
jgi:hypothetical protein